MTFDRAFLNMKISLLIAAALCCMAPIAMADNKLVGFVHFGVHNNTDRLVRIEFYWPGSEHFAWWDVPSGLSGIYNTSNTNPDAQAIDFDVATLCVRAHYRNAPTDAVTVSAIVRNIYVPSFGNDHLRPVTGEKTICASAAQWNNTTGPLTIWIEP
jgi:hypothetical protein